MNENLYDIVSGLIGKGKIEAAIEFLSEANTSSNEVVLIKSRFADLESQRRKGTISQEYYSLQKNILSDSLLDLARKYPSGNEANSTALKGEKTSLFWLKIALPILAIAVVLLVIMNTKNNHQETNESQLADTSLITEEKEDIADEVNSNSENNSEDANALIDKNDSNTSELPPPLFEFEETEVDLGRIKAGTRIEHDVHFINSGDSPLVIQTVKGSCGCLLAKSDKTVYMPGESGVITFSLNTSNRNGANNFKITINNNTEESPYFLEVKSEIFI